MSCPTPFLTLFDNVYLDDLRMLHAARHTARQTFNEKRSLASSSPEAAAGIEHAEGVAVVLRQQVVQGQRVGDGEEERDGGKYREFVWWLFWVWGFYGEGMGGRGDNCFLKRTGWQNEDGENKK